MSLRLSGLAVVLGVLSATGCASTDGAAAQQQAAPTELVYRTGSNIPVREKALTPEEKARRAEESQRALQKVQTTGAGNPKL
jgi:hypothetical protein